MIKTIMLLTTLSMADIDTFIYHIDNLIREVEREDYGLAMTYARASLKVCDDERAVKAISKFMKRMEDAEI
jgi:hypothetical protein